MKDIAPIIDDDFDDEVTDENNFIEVSLNFQESRRESLIMSIKDQTFSKL